MKNANVQYKISRMAKISKSGSDPSAPFPQIRHRDGLLCDCLFFCVANCRDKLQTGRLMTHFLENGPSPSPNQLPPYYY